ncbi:MAG TPA: hypothetical protein EYH07_07935 [Kiloniellaceae bacterium]|nr:hypothetical protein [Kiloniellaceae bacterium]
MAGAPPLGARANAGRGGLTVADMGPFSGSALKAFLATLSAFSIGALVGRLAYHTMQVKAGKRRFWSIDLFWELPLALFCGSVAGAIGIYLALPPLVTFGLCSLVGYLGPRGVEVIVYRVIDRYSKGSRSD